MNSAGKQKDAAWYWMQWASSTEHDLFGARKMDFVNPVRASVWKDDEFRNRIDKSYSGYLAQYDASSPGARIYFTPQPLFFDVTTQWAETLQRMVAKQVSRRRGARPTGRIDGQATQGRGARLSERLNARRGGQFKVPRAAPAGLASSHFAQARGIAA